MTARGLPLLKRLLLGGPVLAVLLGLGWTAGTAQPAPIPYVKLKVGFDRTAFMDLNPKDLEAAVKVLAQSLGRKRVEKFVVETRIYENSSDFEAAIKRDEVNLGILGSWEYSGMEIQAHMEAGFASAHKDRTTTECLLVSRRNEGLDTLKDLKGKDVVLLDSSLSLAAQPWVDVLLAEARLGKVKTFFGKAEIVQKPSAALLPVFFGKRQACAIDRQDYQTMTELNPQLGLALQVLATSPPCLNILVCLGKSDWTTPMVKDVLRETLRDLHLDPEGRQMLMLFKSDRLVPYQESDLAGIRDLRSRYQKLGRKP